MGTGPSVAAGASCVKNSSTGKRPTCPAGHCCGNATEKNVSGTDAAVQTGLAALSSLGINLGPKGDEVCHTSTSTTMERTKDGTKKEYNFKCIVGAHGLVATALSV